MKVKEFIDEFNRSQNKEAFVKKHIVVDYLPYERKIALSEIITKKLFNESGDLIKNTPLVYENFVIHLMREYTDIELADGGSLEDFNYLEKYNVTEYLIKAIGKDAERFNTVLDMTVNDKIDNYNNLINFISLKTENMNFIFDKLQKSAQKVSQVNTPTS